MFYSMFYLGGSCVLFFLCGLYYWGNVAALPKRLYVVVLAVVLGHHAKAGGAAIHGIVLGVVGERHWFV